jgi:hypothetical protein
MAKFYVSSTVADLADERRAVMAWLTADGHQPVHSYQPDSETVRDSCLRDLVICDLYILILGHRYGFQPEADGLSITQLEFRKAGDSGIPRIALLRTSVPDIKLSDLFDPGKVKLLSSFQEEVRRCVRPAEFSDRAGLITALSAGVNRELAKLRGASGQVAAATDESHYLRALETITRQLDQKDAENEALRKTITKLKSELRAELPLPPFAAAPEPRAAELFSEAREEMVLVGSAAVAFVADVSVARREVILNSLLLAQLVASQRVNDQRPIHEWYEWYLDALGNVGWVVHDMRLATSRGASGNFDIRHEILNVAAALLGPSALAIVRAMLESLHALSGTKTETVFDRDACHGNTARFQICVVEQDPQGVPLVSLMAFELTARHTVTQALLVKGERSDFMLRYYGGPTAISTTVLDAVREVIAAKLGERIGQYVETLRSV